MAWIVKTDAMLATDGKRYFHVITQKPTLDFTFDQEIVACGLQQQFWHRAAITQTAVPGTCIVGVGSDEPAFFFVFAAKVISIKITAVDGFTH